MKMRNLTIALAAIVLRIVFLSAMPVSGQTRVIRLSDYQPKQKAEVTDTTVITVRGAKKFSYKRTTQIGGSTFSQEVVYEDARTPSGRFTGLNIGLGAAAFFGQRVSWFPEQIAGPNLHIGFGADLGSLSIDAFGRPFEGGEESMFVGSACFRFGEGSKFSAGPAYAWGGEHPSTVVDANVLYRSFGIGGRYEFPISNRWNGNVGLFAFRTTALHREIENGPTIANNSWSVIMTASVNLLMLF
ncbi:MAG: hypothetical protein AB1352_03395 [Patescibacteria group bacterium]